MQFVRQLEFDDNETNVVRTRSNYQKKPAVRLAVCTTPAGLGAYGSGKTLTGRKLPPIIVKANAIKEKKQSSFRDAPTALKQQSNADSMTLTDSTAKTTNIKMANHGFASPHSERLYSQRLS